MQLYWFIVESKIIKQNVKNNVLNEPGRKPMLAVILPSW